MYTSDIYDCQDTGKWGRRCSTDQPGCGDGHHGEPGVGRQGRETVSDSVPVRNDQSSAACGWAGLLCPAGTVFCQRFVSELAKQIMGIYQKGRFESTLTIPPFQKP